MHRIVDTLQIGKRSGLMRRQQRPHPLLAFCRICLGVSSRRSISEASRMGECCRQGWEGMEGAMREWHEEGRHLRSCTAAGVCPAAPDYHPHLRCPVVCYPLVHLLQLLGNRRLPASRKQHAGVQEQRTC